MMKKGLKITGAIILSILLVYLIIDLNYVYKERYKIIGAKAYLFQVKDTTQECVTLDKFNPSDTTTPIIVAVKFSIECVSLVHEHVYIEDTNKPRGSDGNVDTITTIAFKETSDTGVDLTDSLSNAERYSKFYCKDSLINDHSLWKSPDCYSAVTFFSAKDFIEKYNTSNKYTVGHAKNFHFFTVPRSAIQRASGSKFNIVINFTDGHVITVSV